MVRNIARYRNIYIFIAILGLIGFFSGFIYYKVQNKEIKEEIKETINIEEDLETGFNNIFKNGKKAFLILGCSILVIPSVFNVWKIFYEPFTIGFIFSFLCSYSVKMAFIYFLVYQFIPLLFLLVLIRVGFTIATDLIKLIINRRKQTLEHVKKLLMKYGIITMIFLMYEVLVMIFSTNINMYLLTLI